jgi:gluconate 2-dehydrogenase gamma chain
MKPQTIRRRKFLGAAAAAAAAAGALSCGTRKSPWRFLSAEEAAALAAMADRIIPADQDPGAASSGAVNFIDRHLMGHFKRFRQTYRDGLAALERTARTMFGQKFAGLDAGVQDRLLKLLESGAASRVIWNQVAPRQFFDMVVGHTMQSYYGDPRHGGNRDAASWRMLGVPLVPVRGRDQYDFTKPGGRTA